MKLKLFSALSLLLCLINLSHGEPTPTPAETFIASDEASSVTAPPGWTIQYDLNDSAELQLSNPKKNLYLIVLTEDLSDFVDMSVEKFFRRRVDSFLSKVSQAKAEKDVPVTLGSLKGVSTEIEGVVDGVRIRYALYGLQGKRKFFQLLVWGTKSHFEGGRDAVAAVVRGFAERSVVKP